VGAGWCGVLSEGFGETGVSEFPDWMEDEFGVWFDPSYRQAKEIHRAFQQVNQGVVVDESSEFTPEMWDRLIQRMRAEAKP
jgi:hypothetical protein